MSQVDGQSVNTMDTLSALAQKMGSETAFSASECAQAQRHPGGFEHQHGWDDRQGEVQSPSKIKPPADCRVAQMLLCHAKHDVRLAASTLERT